MSVASFDFHGVGIEVSAEQLDLVEAIAGRLRHFRTDAVEPSIRFTYHVADGERPRPPARGGRPVYDPPAGSVTYFDEEDTLWIDFDGRVVVRCDARAGSVAVWAPEQEYSELWLLSRPLFTLPLVEVLRRSGFFNVHAGGVARGGNSVVIAGSTGAGKSTLTVALARAGFDVLGDDMVFLREADGRLTAHAFPDEIDVTEDTASWFAELRPLLTAPLEPGWPKRRIRSEELYGAIAESSTPVALVFPQIAHTHAQTSTLEPIAPDAALRELAPNILLTDRGIAQAHLDVLATLVARCPAYRLRAALDFDRIAAAVGGLVDGG